MKVTALVSNYQFYSNLRSIFVLKTRFFHMVN